MHPLYAEGMKISEKLGNLATRGVSLSSEISQIEYELRVTKAKVERALIKQVGGEKKLGPTTEDRERIFTLALDADKSYKEQLKHRNEVELNLEQTKAEITSLRTKLNVILAAMRVDETGNK